MSPKQQCSTQWSVIQNEKKIEHFSREVVSCKQASFELGPQPTPCLPPSFSDPD